MLRRARIPRILFRPHPLTKQFFFCRRARIRKIAEAAHEVTAVHDLKTRAAGPTAFIQLHLEMDGAMDLRRAHEISDRVEAELRDAYPHAEIIIHQDPAGLEELHQSFPPRVNAG